MPESGVDAVASVIASSHLNAIRRTECEEDVKMLATSIHDHASKQLIAVLNGMTMNRRVRVRTIVKAIDRIRAHAHALT